MAIKSGNVEGLDSLIRDLSRFGEAAIKEMKPACDRAAAIVLARAKQKARESGPYVTGELADSLFLRRKTNGSGDKKEYFLVLSFGPETFRFSHYSKKGKAVTQSYAVPLELGHKLIRGGHRGSHGAADTGKHIGDVPAKPFMRPAADESKEEVTDVIVTEMNIVLEHLLGDANGEKL